MRASNRKDGNMLAEALEGLDADDDDSDVDIQNDLAGAAGDGGKGTIADLDDEFGAAVGSGEPLGGQNLIEFNGQDTEA